MSESSSPESRPTTPGGSKRSDGTPTGIPRYFKPTQSSTKLVEEKAKLRADFEAEKQASAPLPLRPTTPGRRMTTGSDIPRPITPGRRSLGAEQKLSKVPAVPATPSSANSAVTSGVNTPSQPAVSASSATAGEDQAPASAEPVAVAAAASENGSSGGTISTPLTVNTSESTPGSTGRGIIRKPNLTVSTSSPTPPASQSILSTTTPSVNPRLTKPTVSSASKVQDSKDGASQTPVTPGNRSTTPRRSTTPGRKSSDGFVRSGDGTSPVTPSAAQQPPSLETEVVVQRLLKPTKSRMSCIKDVEESKGQIKPEDDPWWDKRGGRLVEAAKLKETVQKKMAHVTSKLHVPTTTRVLQSREKVVVDKPGSTLAPVPKLSSPDAINPHKHVPSRLHRPTAATLHGEWKPKDEKKPINLSKKAPEVSSRLLQAPIHTVTTKFVKEADPHDIGQGWVKIMPSGSSTAALVKPFEDIRPLPGENMTDRYLDYELDDYEVEGEERGGQARGRDGDTDFATNGAVHHYGNGSPEDRRARSMSRGRNSVGGGAGGGARSRSRPRSASRGRRGENGEGNDQLPSPPSATASAHANANGITSAAVQPPPVPLSV